MSFKIYTKTGDFGKTSLIGGTKVPKSHIRIESYGTVDELNAHLGMVADWFPDRAMVPVLREIQDRLFTIGSWLACDPEKDTKMPIPDLLESDILYLEQQIDWMDAQLPEMKSFIIPGGHQAISATHIARCVCRRTERICVHMQEIDMVISPLIIKYLNRLSDFLFMLSRYAGKCLHIEDIPWRARV
ncbi:MAG: cob(I)yrinic acid a,c-diamide adenosyltransferase [Ferruginibacter sp.]|nr:cob(I)yrinic acid a,c-diamide adenosyltransferase [Ferruginibacter sp.]